MFLNFEDFAVFILFCNVFKPRIKKAFVKFIHII